MEKAGFTNVQADDRTDLFVECLESELKKTEGMRDEFIKVGSNDVFRDVLSAYSEDFNFHFIFFLFLFIHFQC